MDTLKEAILWLFDGIGTELISLLLGSTVGGFAGYRIGVKRCVSQKQTAKDGARQKQKSEAEGNESANNGQITSSVRQRQKAGNNAVQEQIGSVKSGK